MYLYLHSGHAPNKGDVINYKFYAVNSDHEENLLATCNNKLSEFKDCYGWGITLSVKPLMDVENKFWIENSITFVVVVSFLLTYNNITLNC
jgi:hypothetical protein